MTNNKDLEIWLCDCNLLRFNDGDKEVVIEDDEEIDQVIGSATFHTPEIYLYNGQKCQVSIDEEIINKHLP